MPPERPIGKARAGKKRGTTLVERLQRQLLDEQGKGAPPDDEDPEPEAPEAEEAESEDDSKSVDIEDLTKDRRVQEVAERYNSRLHEIISEAAMNAEEELGTEEMDMSIANWRHHDPLLKGEYVADPLWGTHEPSPAAYEKLAENPDYKLKDDEWVPLSRDERAKQKEERKAFFKPKADLLFAKRKEQGGPQVFDKLTTEEDVRLEYQIPTPMGLNLARTGFQTNWKDPKTREDMLVAGLRDVGATDAPEVLRADRIEREKAAEAAQKKRDKEARLKRE